MPTPSIEFYFIGTQALGIGVGATEAPGPRPATAPPESRTKFLAGQLVVIVPVKSLEIRGGVLQFVTGEFAILVFVQRLHHGQHAHHAAEAPAAGTAAGASASGSTAPPSRLGLCRFIESIRSAEVPPTAETAASNATAQASRPAGHHAHVRLKFVPGQLAVAVLVQCFECPRGVFDLAGVDCAVLIGVQCDHHGQHPHHAVSRTAATAAPTTFRSLSQRIMRTDHDNRCEQRDTNLIHGRASPIGARLSFRHKNIRDVTEHE